MNIYKNEIEKLRKLYARCGEEYLNAIGAAIMALERENPQKVTKLLTCPKCHNTAIGSGDYCYNCGQRLRWGDDKTDERSKQ